MSNQGCGCGRVKYNLVFSCSGAADVGFISDQTARALSKEKTASMCCVAAISAAIPEIVDMARNADKILTIDGCSKDCARIMLENAGLTNIRHLQLETLGMKKNESPLTEERLETALKNARLALIG